MSFFTVLGIISLFFNENINFLICQKKIGCNTVEYTKDLLHPD